MEFCANGALVVSQALQRTTLAAMVDTDGLLDGAKIKLFQNDLVPSPTTVIGDLTVASFAGYAAQDADWGTVYNMPDGGAGVVSPTDPFVATGVGLPQTIYGFYFTDTAGTALLGVRRLAEPQTVNVAGDAVQINAEYYLPGPVGDVVPVV